MSILILMLSPALSAGLLEEPESCFLPDFVTSIGHSVERFDLQRQRFYFKKAGQYTVSVRVLRHEGDRTLINEDENQLGFAGAQRELGVPGLPVGTDVRFWNQAPVWGQWSASVRSRRFRFGVVVEATPKMNAQRFRVAPDHVWTTEQVTFFEAYTRRLVARNEASSLRSEANATFGGANVPTLRCPRTRQRFGNLHAWTRQRGWSWTHHERGYATLRKGSDYAVIPLGAQKIKVNGTWITLPDLVVEQGNEWYVDPAALTELGRLGGD